MAIHYAATASEMDNPEGECRWTVLEVVRLSTAEETLSRLRLRVVAQAVRASAHADAIAQSLGGKPEAYRREMAMLCQSLERFSRGQFTEAVSEECRQTAFDLSEQRRRLNSEIESALSGVEAQVAEKARRAILNLESYLQNDQDLQGGARAVRKSLADVLSEFNLESGGAIWFLTGLAAHLSSDEVDEAIYYLEGAIKSGAGNPTETVRLATRLMTAILLAREESQSAYEVVMRGGEQGATADMHLTAWEIAASMEHLIAAKRYLDHALRLSTLNVIHAFASGPIGPSAIELMEHVVKGQMAVRQDARNQHALWVSAARKVHEVERATGIRIDVSSLLLDGHHETSSEIESADFFTGRFLRRECARSAEHLLRTGREQLALEHRSRMDALAKCRQQMEAAWEVRQSKVRSALSQQQCTVEEAQKALVASTHESERAQKGCIHGAAMGCAFGGLYMVTAIVLGIRGIQVGPWTPIGMIAIGVALLPVALSFLQHVGFILRRSALDSQLSAGIANATAAYEQDVKLADAEYNEQVSTVRDALREAEMAANKTSEALKLLNVPLNRREAA